MKNKDEMNKLEADSKCLQRVKKMQDYYPLEMVEYYHERTLYKFKHFLDILPLAIKSFDFTD